MPEGICLGGPYKNKRLRHYTKEYVVADMTVPILEDWQTEPPDKLIKWGTYRYALGYWKWSEDASYPREPERSGDMGEGSH